MITASVLLDELDEVELTQVTPVQKKTVPQTLSDSPPLSYGFIDNDETQIAHEHRESPLVIGDSPMKDEITLIDSNSYDPPDIPTETTPSKQDWRTSDRKKKSELLSPKKQRKPKLAKGQLKLETFFSPVKKRELSQEEQSVEPPKKKQRVQIESTYELLVGIGSDSNSSIEPISHSNEPIVDVIVKEQSLSQEQLIIEESSQPLKEDNTSQQCKKPSPSFSQILKQETEESTAPPVKEQPLSLEFQEPTQTPTFSPEKVKRSSFSQEIEQSLPFSVKESPPFSQLEVVPFKQSFSQEFPGTVTENVFYSDSPNQERILPTANFSVVPSLFVDKEGSISQYFDSRHSVDLVSLPFGSVDSPTVESLTSSEGSDNQMELRLSESIDFDNMDTFVYPRDSQGFSLDFRVAFPFYIDSQQTPGMSGSVVELSQLPPLIKQATRVPLVSRQEQVQTLDSQRITEVAFNESAFMYDDLMPFEQIHGPILYSQGSQSPEL
jgi:hypothetical protein